jgi:hypothetical protein
LLRLILNHDPPISASQIAGIIDVSHCVCVCVCVRVCVCDACVFIEFLHHDMIASTYHGEEAWQNLVRNR